MSRGHLIFATCIITIGMFLHPGAAFSGAYLGVLLENIDAGGYEELGLKEQYGVLISDIIDSGPAGEAGLEDDDVILEIDGDRLYTYGQLVKMLSLHEPGDVVKIKAVRDGKTKMFKVTLGEKEEWGRKVKKKAFLGIVPENLSQDEYEKLGIEERYGIRVEKALKDKPAREAGMEDGDVLLEIDGEKVYTTDQLHKMLAKYEPEDKMKVKCLRKGEYRTFDVVLGETAEILHDLGLNLLGVPGKTFVYRYDDDHCKYIGVEVMSLNEQLEDAYGVDHGVLVKKIFDDTPAEEAGLLAGDVIVRIDGRKINSGGDIVKVVNKKEVGDTVEVEVRRAGKDKKMKVGIAEKEDCMRQKNINIQIDVGDAKIIIDGEEEFLYNIENHLKGLKGLEPLKELKHLKRMEALEILNETEQKKLELQMKHLDENLKHFDGELKLELKVRQDAADGEI